MFCLEAFLFYLCLFGCCFLCFRLVYLSFAFTIETTHIKTNNKNIKKLRENHKTQTTKQNYIISQPEPERCLFAVGSWAGYPVFLLLFNVFSRSFSVLLMFVRLLFLMFSPSLFKLCIYNRNNTHNNKQQKHKTTSRKT